MSQNVLTIDHAPVVGRSYLVPTIHTTWGGRLDHWPMFGAAHQETEGLWDWHLDYRFLTHQQEVEAAKQEVESEHVNVHARPTCPKRRWLGSRASRQFTIVSCAGLGDFPPVEMRWLVCRRETIQPEPLAVPWPELHRRFGPRPRAVPAAGGRWLCPHQKVDLTHWPREADGTVICPLHRLRVEIPA